MFVYVVFLIIVVWVGSCFVSVLRLCEMCVWVVCLDMLSIFVILV